MTMRRLLGGAALALTATVFYLSFGDIKRYIKMTMM
jgi:hypothetical protein